MSNILVTGAAGFIGFHLIKSLHESNDKIFGLDNLQNNHDYKIKLKRLEQLNINSDTLINDLVADNGNLNFVKIDLLDKDKLNELFYNNNFEIVIHLAAQTGVRHSALYPQQYIDNNITAFNNLLECCRDHKVKKMMYASSSSVYGMHKNTPSKETDSTDSPTSIYAITKKTCELLAYGYTLQNDMVCTGLRFFTVYGPWCRTDMAAYIFMKALVDEKQIDLFNNGDMLRDFTYVDDICKSIRLIKEKLLFDSPTPPYHEIFNIGNRTPISLFQYKAAIEKDLGKIAIFECKPIQYGEVIVSFADVIKLENFIGFKPDTDLQDGVKKMTDWFKTYYEDLKG